MTAIKKDDLLTKIRKSYFFQYEMYIRILLKSEKLIILFKNLEHLFLNTLNSLDMTSRIKKSDVLNYTEEIAFEKLMYFHFPQKDSSNERNIQILSYEDFRSLLYLSTEERKDLVDSLCA